MEGEKIYKEEKYRRVFVVPYNSGGWIIGECNLGFICWLDDKYDEPIIVAQSDLAY